MKNKWFGVEGKIDYHDKWLRVGRHWVGWWRNRFHVVPVIQGAGKAVTGQNDRYAFGDDDGSESGHTLDTENTNRGAQTADVTFMIRIQVQETAGGTDNLPAELRALKNSTGDWDAVTTTSTNGIIIADDTQSRADDENTTERLTAPGSGTWAAGKYDDGQTQQGTTAVTLDTNYTEFEFAIQIDSTYAADNDVFELRIEWTDGTHLDFYPGSFPTVTADIPFVGQPTQIRTQGVPTGSGFRDRPGKYNIWTQLISKLEMFTKYITNEKAFLLVN